MRRKRYEPSAMGRDADESHARNFFVFSSSLKRYKRTSDPAEEPTFEGRHHMRESDNGTPPKEKSGRDLAEMADGRPTRADERTKRLEE